MAVSSTACLAFVLEELELGLAFQMEERCRFSAGRPARAGHLR